MLGLCKFWPSDGVDTAVEKDDLGWHGVHISCYFTRAVLF